MKYAGTFGDVLCKQTPRRKLMFVWLWINWIYELQNLLFRLYCLTRIDEEKYTTAPDVHEN